ncbi:dihydroxyacetone/glyceraldehyde kinase [Williamsoniiplasma somnilux]|uniref:Dihydroxyacetone/glyceraldehyde kinase n=1 Tax=Williamsoniiplasma somnilux TaxID=215578 RepID=A0A2K8NYH6_9MOLU|nr:DAK2 domain-containing protein [Williamsoniiplasma somnilux]ATZ18606.1 dihydroxyacetone/glyceraldehyde kinase [Williamsoniiplasma somnilux]
MKKIQELMNMLTSGVNNLYNNYPHIDKLNVFPVPDGDTGTNMNLTANNGYNDIVDGDFKSIGDLLSAFARGLIMGARGNSGVIFSQIMKGFSRGMTSAKELSVAEWKQGLQGAKEISYKAVMKPVEGTILTVIRETSEAADSFADDMDIKEFWKEIVKVANISLENTPNLLQALKDVGVVDSGGYGLVKFFEGIASVAIEDKIIPKTDKLEINEGGNIEMQLEDSEFGYCTEAVVLLSQDWIDKLEVNTIKEQLQIYGNTSMVVVIDEDILKIHTHALTPGQVLLFLQQYGDFKTVKVENMNLQADKQIKGGNPNVKTEWKETSSIKAERKLRNEMATIAVVPSQELKDYYESELGIDLVINGGSKMNPSTNDFLKAIEQVDAKTVFIMPNNSNVILTAKQAEKEETKSKIYVIPTKTIQQGMSSALSFDSATSPSKNNTNLTKAIKNVVSFSVSKAAKDSTVDGIKIKKNQQMSIVDNKIVDVAQSLKTVFEKHLAKYITNKTEILTIFIGQDADAKNVNDLRKFLDENFDVEYEIIEGGQKIYSFIIGIE